LEIALQLFLLFSQELFSDLFLHLLLNLNLQLLFFLLFLKFVYICIFKFVEFILLDLSLFSEF
jgi:hypothetical protein